LPKINNKENIYYHDLLDLSVFQESDNNFGKIVSGLLFMDPMIIIKIEFKTKKRKKF
jgi:hypothetical protein